MKQKGKFCPPNFLIFCLSGDFRDAFCVAEGPFGHPCIIHYFNNFNSMFYTATANYSTYLFRQRLCSRLTALWRFINVLLLLSSSLLLIVSDALYIGLLNEYMYMHMHFNTSNLYAAFGVLDVDLLLIDGLRVGSAGCRTVSAYCFTCASHWNETEQLNWNKILYHNFISVPWSLRYVTRVSVALLTTCVFVVICEKLTQRSSKFGGKRQLIREGWSI